MNFTHLEPKMWFTLIGIMVFGVVYWKNLPRLLHFAYIREAQQHEQALKQQQLEPIMKTQSDDGNDVEEVPSQQNIKTNTSTTRNSLQQELLGKLFGIFLLSGAGLIHYVIQQNNHFLDKWQTHAIMFVIVCFTWIYGTTRPIPRSWDIIVNIAFFVWAFNILFI